MMDVRGDCCVARYAGNPYDLSTMDWIMLRFRPIAPKPAANGSGSGNSGAEKSSLYVKTGRGKRRYVRNKRKKNDSSDGSSTASVTKKCTYRNRKRVKSQSSEENESINGGSRGSGGEKDAVVTLSLLPETPEREDSRSVKGFPTGINFGSGESRDAGGGFWMSGAAGMVAQPLRVVGTLVHVECITQTRVNGFGYGGIGWVGRGMLTDLERDTYPGFVSDGLERVVWVNRAYREMAAGLEEEEVLVWLVVKEGVQLPPESWPGFTCSVRVVTCGEEKSSRTLLCDVWRLEGGGGFAWRLDVKAALSLGR